MKSPHLLIVGCGDIGSRVADLLLNEGWFVSGFCRSADRLSEIFSYRVSGDYTNKDDLRRLSNLNSSYVLVTPTPSSKTLDGYQRGYLRCAMSLQQSGLLQDIRRTVFVTSTRVYSESEGGEVTEASRLNIADPIASVLINAENIVRRATRSTIVRPSGLYGGRAIYLIRQVASGARSSDSSRISNRIHRADLAGLLAQLFLLDWSGEHVGATVLATDDQPTPIGEIEEWLSTQLNTDFTRVVPNMTKANRRCINDLMKMLGYKLRYPSYREGFEELLKNIAPISKNSCIKDNL